MSTFSVTFTGILRVSSLSTTGVRYDVEMDALVGDVESRRGCLYQPGARHDCQPLSSGVMTFPDDIIEKRSTEARWVAVFPVGGANSKTTTGKPGCHRCFFLSEKNSP